MSTLTIELKVPIKTEPLVGAPALTFSHWLPMGKQNGIALSEGDISLTLWFDLETTWWASQPKEEDLKNHVNVLARYVNAEIVLSSIDGELADYMQNPLL